jgi:hypothetical protein
VRYTCTALLVAQAIAWMIYSVDLPGYRVERTAEMRLAGLSCILGGLTAAASLLPVVAGDTVCQRALVIGRRVLGTAFSAAGPYITYSAPQITQNNFTIIDLCSGGFFILGTSIAVGFEAGRFFCRHFCY